MFKELETVQWHPDEDVNERLNLIVLQHPDLGSLDTPAKRFAYIIKKSRKERFWLTTQKHRNRWGIRKLYNRVSKSRYAKSQRRIRWTSDMACKHFHNISVHTRVDNLKHNDFSTIVLADVGTWFGGGRLWMWKQNRTYPLTFIDLYAGANYFYHIDCIIQRVTQKDTRSIYSLLKRLLVDFTSNG